MPSAVSIPCPNLYVQSFKTILWMMIWNSLRQTKADPDRPRQTKADQGSSSQAMPCTWMQGGCRRFFFEGHMVWASIGLATHILISRLVTVIISGTWGTFYEFTATNSFSYHFIYMQGVQGNSGECGGMQGNKDEYRRIQGYVGGCSGMQWDALHYWLRRSIGFFFNVWKVPKSRRLILAHFNPHNQKNGTCESEMTQIKCQFLWIHFQNWETWEIKTNAYI